MTSAIIALPGVHSDLECYEPRRMMPRNGFANQVSIPAGRLRLFSGQTLPHCFDGRSRFVAIGNAVDHDDVAVDVA